MKDQRDIRSFLLKDLEFMRAEIQKVSSYHWRYSLGYIPSILSIMGGLVLAHIQKNQAFTVILFVFAAYLVLAQMAAVFNYHYASITALSFYIQTIEHKINALFNGAKIIEYETTFDPIF